ncbi:hypothetical protein [Streptosporangium sp. NPDC023615]|uniref:hypothetical protein n=1 Tax=Streptosporangium sp. NPDC023615 TaxID=3154794 RepID=UPI00342EEDD6
MNARERRIDRLRTLVLLLYPAGLRHRYGPEIRALLEDSPTPVRDLADVARTGARERVAAALSPRPPRHRPLRDRLPYRVWRWSVALTAMIAALAAPWALSGTAPWAAPAAGIAIGLMFTYREAAKRRPALTLVLMTLTLHVPPYVPKALSDATARTPDVIVTIVFGVALTLVVPLLRRRPGHRTPMAAGVVAVLALPPAATALFASMGGLARPWSSYWLAMSSPASGALTYYPALYTCCAFVLLAAAAAEARRAPGGHVTAPGESSPPPAGAPA